MLFILHFLFKCYYFMVFQYLCKNDLSILKTIMTHYREVPYRDKLTEDAQSSSLWSICNWVVGCCFLIFYYLEEKLFRSINSQNHSCFYHILIWSSGTFHLITPFCRNYYSKETKKGFSTGRLASTSRRRPFIRVNVKTPVALLMCEFFENVFCLGTYLFIYF